MNGMIVTVCLHMGERMGAGTALFIENPPELYIRWDGPMMMMMTAATAATTTTTTTTAIPHYMIILSLTFVPPAASCYKGVCHFMCSNFLVTSWVGFFLFFSLSFIHTLIHSIPFRWCSNDKEKKLWYIKKRNVSKEWQWICVCVYFSVRSVVCIRRSKWILAGLT